MFKIDEKLLRALLDYLSKRPFIEVTNLINALSKIQKIVEEEEKEATTSTKIEGKE